MGGISAGLVPPAGECCDFNFWLVNGFVCIIRKVTLIWNSGRLCCWSSPKGKIKEECAQVHGLGKSFLMFKNFWLLMLNSTESLMEEVKNTNLFYWWVIDSVLMVSVSHANNLHTQFCLLQVSSCSLGPFLSFWI